MESLRFARALERTWELIRRANKFVEEREPWKLAKAEPRGVRLASTMYQLAETLRFIGVLTMPFMPTKAEGIRTQLGLSGEPLPLAQELTWGHLSPGTLTQKGLPLFPRIEPTRSGDAEE